MFHNPGVNNTVYIHNPGAGGGGFVSYTAGGGGNPSCENIQVGQSFFVKPSTSSFTFEADDRVHTDGVAFLKSNREDEPLEKNSLVLNTTGGNTTGDEAYIMFRNNGVEAYDDITEAVKSFSIYKEGATELWTMSSDNMMLTLNTMPELSEETTYNIPLHFKAGTNAIFGIIVSGIESFDEGIKIEIEVKA